MGFSPVHVFVMETLSLLSSVQSLVRAVQYTSSSRGTGTFLLQVRRNRVWREILLVRVKIEH